MDCLIENQISIALDPENVIDVVCGLLSPSYVSLLTRQILDDLSGAEEYPHEPGHHPLDRIGDVLGYHRGPALNNRKVFDLALVIFDCRRAIVGRGALYVGPLVSIEAD